MYFSTGQYTAISLRILYTWRMSVQVGICQSVLYHDISWYGAADIWNLAKPDIWFLPDIGSPNDTISGHVSRYRVFLLTRYRDMSDVTRYRVPISGTHPISGHHVTDIVNHIPDIGINIGYNIGCPNIGDMISRYRCQYRVPISGVPISGYQSHRYRQPHTRYRDQYRVQHRVSRYRGIIATDIVSHIPDIGINIGYNSGCPDIGEMISRYWCQYRVPISGVPI